MYRLRPLALLILLLIGRASASDNILIICSDVDAEERRRYELLNGQVRTGFSTSTSLEPETAFGVIRVEQGRTNRERIAVSGLHGNGVLSADGGTLITVSKRSNDVVAQFWKVADGSLQRALSLTNLQMEGWGRPPRSYFNNFVRLGDGDEFLVLGYSPGRISRGGATGFPPVIAVSFTANGEQSRVEYAGSNCKNAQVLAPTSPSDPLLLAAWRYFPDQRLPQCQILTYSRQATASNKLAGATDDFFGSVVTCGNGELFAFHSKRRTLTAYPAPYFEGDALVEGRRLHLPPLPLEKFTAAAIIYGKRENVILLTIHFVNEYEVEKGETQLLLLELATQKVVASPRLSTKHFVSAVFNKTGDQVWVLTVQPPRITAYSIRDFKATFTLDVPNLAPSALKVE